MKSKFLKILKEESFLFMMCIITFLTSIFFFYFTIGDDWSYRYIIILCGVFPFLFYLVITIVSIKFSNIKTVQTITSLLSIAFSLILLFYYFHVLFLSLIMETDHPSKDIKYYSHYVKSDYLLEVFPNSIPNNVENVQLLYSPGLLQAGTMYSLYYVDKSLQVENFDNRYMEKAEWVGYIKNYDDKDGLLSGRFYNTPVEYKIENFRMYLIDSYCDDSGYCNHGRFLLVAINQDTKEVIYRSESW